MGPSLKERTKCGLEKLKEPDKQGYLLMFSIIKFILSCGIPTKGKNVQIADKENNQKDEWV